MAMNRTLASGVAVVVVGLLVGACSVFGGKAAEEPKYRIVLADGDIEVRAYEPYAVAWTTAQGSFDDAVRIGFQRLFEYITGANASASDIEMTAPVLTEPESLEAGAIVAAPQHGEDSGAPTTLAGADIDGWSIGFVLPAGYTAATAPAPTGADVVVSGVAARCVASIRFTGKLGDEAGEAESHLDPRAAVDNDDTLSNLPSRRRAISNIRLRTELTETPMKNCIICWQPQQEFSDEHVIPKALGGYYHIRSVCKKCNSHLGSHVDSKLVNHLISRFARYTGNLTGKSKTLPNPFIGTHTLATDPGQKVRLHLDTDGKFHPHLVPKIDYDLDLDRQELRLSVVVDASDRDKILPSIEKKYGLDIDRQSLPIESSPATVRARFSVDTLEFKIGLLKIAYEFAIDNLPSYRNDESATSIAAVLTRADYEEAATYAAIGNGLDRSILQSLREIIDFQKENHYLILITSPFGIVCFVHLHNSFSIGVRLSERPYPSDIVVGVNDIVNKKFELYDSNSISHLVFGTPEIRLQYFFATEAELIEFIRLQNSKTFGIHRHENGFPLFDVDGRDLRVTIESKVADLAMDDIQSLDANILDVEMDQEVYVRVHPTNTLVRVTEVRLEYRRKNRL